MPYLFAVCGGLDVMFGQNVSANLVSLHLVGAIFIKWSNSAQTTETCYSAPVWVALLTNIAETAFSMQKMVHKNQSKHLTGDLMWPSDDHPIHLLEISLLCHL